MSRFVYSAFADEIAPDLQTQILYLKKFKIDYIELRKVNDRDVFKFGLDEVREIRKQLDASGIHISSVGSSIGKMWIKDDFKAHLELFKNTIEISHILDSKYIRMFSFRIPEGEDQAKHRDTVMSYWQQFIEAAAGSGLILLHENEKGIYGNIPERCLDLHKTMNCSYFKAAFDPANFLKCGVEAFPKSFEMLREHIVYIHIKDGRYNQQAAMPAGEGDGKIYKILKTLFDSGYEGFLSLEPHLDKYDISEAVKNDPELEEYPEGGPQRFALAYRSLDRIVRRITG